jgi:hypothetical protein
MSRRAGVAAGMLAAPLSAFLRLVGTELSEVVTQLGADSTEAVVVPETD